MLTLPTLHCPFESKLNPRTDAANAETIRWAKEFGLISSHDLESQLKSERYTWLVGGFFPDAQDAELQLIADFTGWLFWHDDVCDETDLGSDPEALAKTFDRLFEVLTGRRVATISGCFEAALCDMRHRLEALAPDAGWLLRFKTSTREYFDACVWEAKNRDTGAVPSVGRFIPLRRCAGGMWIYKDFVELVNRRSLPLELRQHRDVQRLVQIAQNVACWHNDIFSLEKELRRGDVHNLVTAIAAEQGVEADVALQIAASYANAEVHVFQALRGKMTQFNQPLQARFEEYANGLQSLMQGNLDWSLSSGRYAEQADREIFTSEQRPSETRELRPRSVDSVVAR